MPDELKDIEKLPPKERIKKLRELEEQRKKEITELERQIQKSLEDLKKEEIRAVELLRETENKKPAEAEEAKPTLEESVERTPAPELPKTEIQYGIKAEKMEYKLNKQENILR